VSRLYVVEFSSGHIKVGASTDPKARIAQHESRVACLGITLLRHVITDPVVGVAGAEDRLIKWCSQRATR